MRRRAGAWLGFAILALGWATSPSIARAAINHLVAGLEPTLVYDVYVAGDRIATGVQPDTDGILAFTADMAGSVQIVEVGEGDTTPPAAIGDLAVTGVGPGSISLTWTAPGDDGNTGTASAYEIRWSHDAALLQSTAERDGNPPTPGAPSTSEAHDLQGLPGGSEIFVAVKTRDEVGNWSPLSNVVSSTPEAGGDPPGDPGDPPDDPGDPAPLTPPGAPGATYDGSLVVLTWSPSPSAIGYHVYRRPEGEVEARLTPSPLGVLEFTDTDAIAGQGYFYRVSAVDGLLNESPRSAETWIRAASGIPAGLVMDRVYPNPVRTRATFRFQLPEVGPGYPDGMLVTIDVFDVSGRHVARVFEAPAMPGVREVAWQPAASGKAFVPGVYVSVLRAGDRQALTKFAVAP